MFGGYIGVSLSVCPAFCQSFSSFFVPTRSKQLLDKFRSNSTNRLNFLQRCAYYTLVTELLPFDEISTGHSRLILCDKEQFLGKELLGYSSLIVLGLVFLCFLSGSKYLKLFFLRIV